MNSIINFKKFLLVALMLVVANLSAITAGPQHFKAEAQPSKLELKAGEKFSVKVTLKFEKNWHSYGTRKIVGADGFGPEQTVIKVSPTSLATITGKMKLPKMDKHFDEAFETEVDYMPQNSVIEIPLTAKKDMDLRKDKLNVLLHMQQCDKTTCLPPDDFTVKVGTNTYTSTIITEENTAPEAEEVAVEETPAEENVATAPAAQPAEEEVKTEETTTAKSDAPGFWTTLLLSMLAGLGAFVTPCVFPMVPITVSFFTKRNEQAPGKGLRDALVYALGIIFSFTLLGVLVAGLLGPAGMQELAASPWFNLAIVGIFLLFGFSLFGAYELQLPTSWTNKLNSKSNSTSGIASVILMAITFALTSFSCTGPLVAAALVSASQGEWFYPIVSMLGFSSMLALPFFFLALFPAALNKLPRAGGWMNNVKVILGFIVLAVTLKYLNNALLVWNAEISRDLFLAIWIAIAFLCTIYVLGLFKTNHDAPVNGVGVSRILFAMLFGTWMFYMITGIGNSRQLGFLESMLPMPSEEATPALVAAGVTPAASAQLEWFDTYQAALDDAKANNRMLLVDFTGKTCTNCKMMEKKLYPNAKVQEALGKFSRAKLYTDKPENKDIQLKMFNTVALPLYAIIDPNTGKSIGTIDYTDDPDKFVEFLNKGIK